MAGVKNLHPATAINQSCDQLVGSADELYTNGEIKRGRGEGGWGADVWVLFFPPHKVQVHGRSGRSERNLP